MQRACRCNVDMLKLIQLGLTFTDAQGNLPKCSGELCVWQFNFRQVLLHEASNSLQGRVRAVFIALFSTPSASVVRCTEDAHEVHVLTQALQLLRTTTSLTFTVSARAGSSSCRTTCMRRTASSC